MCWYCYYGWPKPIADIYDKYLPLAGHSVMHYGPAHIVWEDENFAREHVQWCLDHFEEYRHPDGTDTEHEALRSSLREMLALPDSVLEAGEAYMSADGDARIEDYPPPTGMEMIRR